MDAFVWSRDLPLGHPAVPAATAIVYLVCCAVHNARLPSRTGTPSSGAGSKRLDRAAVAHNVVLVGFSALTCVCSARHLAASLQREGLHAFLCPPPSAAAAGAKALSGPLFSWCYVFYVSKYYELVDTLLIVLRRKRVIVLHAFHHGLMPLVMWLSFDSRAGIPLVGLAVINAFVHVVMYTYYLASALRLQPPLWWKRQITELQLAQFSLGVCGASYYWIHFFAPPRTWKGLREWPPLEYVEGCAGGDPRVLFLGDCMNVCLIGMFGRFYYASYVRPRPKRNRKRE